MRAPHFIGTSGWHYPHWRGVFYPRELSEPAWLEYYSRFFATVEVNSSFYRLPTPATLESWRGGTPPGFRFAVKASRFITHMKKLRDAPATLARFLPLLQILGDKCGPLLFQLPPRWGCNRSRFAAFLETLPPHLPCAFELRDPGWHCAEVYALLRRHNAACCIFDIGGFRSPIKFTADFAYLRLHGPGAPYSGCYGAAALREWAARIESWGDLRAVYVYFNNDQAGYAVRNARELRALLGTEVC